jgi:O-antigen/teichoic acid export membrane protein
MKLIKIRKREHLDLNIKKLLKVSAPMMLIALSSYFIGNISVYIIQVFESKYQVGVFALSLKLSLFISFVLIGVNTVIAPKISELYWSNKKKELKDLIRSKTQFIFWISLVIFLVIVIFSKKIIYLINEDFSSGITVLIVLSFGQLINACCGPVGLLLNMTGNEKPLMKASISVLFLTIVLNTVFIYHFGIFGAAIATALSIGIKNIILVIIARKKLNINPLYIPFINND